MANSVKDAVRTPASRGNRQNPEKKFDIARRTLGDILEEMNNILRAESGQNRKLNSLQKLSVDLQLTRRKWENQRFQVAVLALIKTGKSTLINAWLGDEYLPSSNVPETAQIVRIRHNPHEERGVLFGQGEVKAAGAGDINDYLRNLNADIRQNRSAAGDGELVLEAPLTALVGKPLGEQGFDILDTPGPNDAGEEGLRRKVERLLDEVDVIIYLLDYTKLKADDEQEVLNKLASIRPELLRRYTGRLFFVVNKIDQENRSSLTVEETADYVAQLLNKQIEGLTITPDRVLLVSAEDALLARLVQSGRASDAAVNDFAKKALGKFAAQRTREVCLPYAPSMLESSRLPLLEDEILSYIYQQRGNLLLESLLGDIERQLNSLSNHLSVSKKTLQTEVVEMERQVKQLRAELKRITDDLQGTLDKFDAFKSETEAWVHAQFQSFQQQVNSLIEDALLNADGAKQKMNGERGNSIGRFFGTLMAGIEDILKRKERDSQEAVLKDVRKLNKRIGDYLKMEFEQFRVDLEAVLRDRQRELFGELKANAEPLLRQIENRVGESLRINLRPASIKIPSTSLEEMHKEIQESVSNFVESRKSTRTEEVTESVLVKKGGWCTDDQYEDRTRTKEVSVTNYAVSVVEVHKTWSRLIQSMTNASVLTARHIIKEKIGQAIDTVSAQLKGYAESYVSTIEREIEQSKGGETQRDARLKQVSAHLERTAELLERTQDCRQFVGVEA